MDDLSRQFYTHSGHWSLGPHLCYINSFITMVIWMEHMIMFAMLKVDKMLISMLPVGEENINVASSIIQSMTFSLKT